MCRRLDLFGRELLAVDGTRIKAVNNKDRNFTTGSLQKFIEAADKKLEDYLKRLDAGDAEERATGGSRVKNLAEKIEALKKKRGEYAAHLSALEKSGESQVSLTDPDSRAMAAHTKVGVGYNIQIAVDAKHKMIVEQTVSNDVLDMGLLQRTAEPAREILEVEKIDVVADKGYFRTEDIASCEEAGLTPYVPRPQRGAAVKNGFFRKDEFHYDAKQNAYICPAGQALTPIREGKLRALKKVDYGNAKACRACALRPHCTKDVRAVSRVENEDTLDRMAERLKARPEILERRREIVEHPFGSIKQWMNQGAFLKRIERSNLRVETLISIWFMAHLPSQSSVIAPSQLGRACSLPSKLRSRGRAISTLPPWKPILPFVLPQRCAVRSLPRPWRGPHAVCASASIISPSASSPAARQSLSKLAEMLASASIFNSLAGIAVGA